MHIINKTDINRFQPKVGILYMEDDIEKKINYFNELFVTGEQIPAHAEIHCFKIPDKDARDGYLYGQLLCETFILNASKSIKRYTYKVLEEPLWENTGKPAKDFVIFNDIFIDHCETLRKKAEEIGYKHRNLNKLHIPNDIRNTFQRVLLDNLERIYN